MRRSNGNVGPRRRMQRAGHTLLELVAVFLILGIIAAAGAIAFRGGVLDVVEAEITARHIATQLHEARRRAISHGDNHLVGFTSSGGDVVGFTLQRRLGGGGTEDVNAYSAVPDGLTVTVSPSDPEFEFEGNATATTTISVAGNGKTWQITVVAVTGSTQFAEL
jgi:type II secretory pathway pseudopilin PulG